MASYEIIITPDAEADLMELCDYISDVLFVPDTALNYIRQIRNEISKLSYMAMSIALVPDEPWRSYGIRKIQANNFYVYYRVDESNNTVYVLNIIYKSRNQLKMLAKMNIK